MRLRLDEKAYVTARSSKKHNRSTLLFKVLLKKLYSNRAYSNLTSALQKPPHEKFLPTPLVVPEFQLMTLFLVLYIAFKKKFEVSETIKDFFSNVLIMGKFL